MTFVIFCRRSVGIRLDPPEPKLIQPVVGLLDALQDLGGFFGTGQVRPPVRVGMDGDQLVIQEVPTPKTHQQDNALPVVALALVEDEIPQAVEDRHFLRSTSV